MGSISEFIIRYESFLRFGFSSLLFIIMAFWETARPKRKPEVDRITHYLNNILLVFLNTILIGLSIPFLLWIVYLLIPEGRWGLLYLFNIPSAIRILIAIVLLDLTVYAQHIIFHKIGFLWKLHIVHHTDPEYDLTTGTRFHPVEQFLSMLIKFTAALSIGCPPEAFIIFEILLNTSAMFNHGNMRIPENLDLMIRTIIVTLDMHRIHHSQDDHEMNRNFGFFLSCWDRWFHTYRKLPHVPFSDLVIGISGRNDRHDVVYLPGLLMQPFRRN